MIECVQYDNMVFTHPEIIFIDGEYGNGYILSSTHKNVAKQINISHSSIKEWFEEGCVKLISSNLKTELIISKNIPWKLIIEWCKCGAYTSYWDN